METKLLSNSENDLNIAAEINSVGRNCCFPDRNSIWAGR